MIFAQPVRTQLGFRYRNENFAIVWTTSQPQSLEAAFAYFCTVEKWGLKPRYLEMREAGQDAWTPIAKQYVNGKVIDV